MKLADTKPGNVLAIIHEYSAPERVTVERVTASQVVAGGRRWVRRNGFEVGSAARWISPHVEPWAATHDAMLARHIHARKCQDAADDLRDAAETARNAGRLDALRAALVVLREGE